MMVQIPVMNATLEREATLDELRRAGAARIWLCTARGIETEDILSEEERLLRENRQFFEENGIEVGVWLSSLGHGGALVQDDPRALERAGQYEKLVGLNGTVCEDSFCPSGEAFARDYVDWIGRIARTGARMIMLDDDYRLSLRSCGNGCCCDRHMSEYRARVGEPVAREQMKDLIFRGGPNKYRDAWLDMGREALLGLARRIRARVDQVDSTIRVGVCAVMTTWDVDGVNAMELTRALAGNTRPFLRTIGAPYWSSNEPKTRRLGYVISLNRLQSYWCEGEGIELFSEGDAYPRPRYCTPASFLEMYDMALRADGGFDGILKYMIDYTSSIRYERGYIDRMERNAPVYKWIERHLSGGVAEGADVICRYDRLRRAELPEGMSMDEVNEAFFFPAAQFLLADCGLPVAYGTRGAHVACGESGRYVTTEQLDDGMVLDIQAARLLMEKGVDVGIAALSEPETRTGIEVFPGERERVAVGKMKWFQKAALKEGAQVLSRMGEDPVCYEYENAAGQRFVVYLFDMDTSWKGLGVTRSYCRQRQLIHGLEWAGRKKLPAVCPGQPDIYLICKRNGEGLTVGLWNLSADYIANAGIRLDRAYAEAEVFGAEGRLDGEILRLNGDLPPYAFAGIRLKN